MHDRIFLGTIINPSVNMTVDVIQSGFVIVVLSKILAMGPIDQLRSVRARLGSQVPKCISEVTLGKHQFLIPGLIDTHIHAPQYPNIGLGYDEPLLEWLSKYTYKLESRYSDLRFSRNVYDSVVRKTLGYGTTTALYFGSLYADSTLVLVNSTIDRGQRAYVGKVNMIRMAPQNYVETPAESLNATIEFIEAVLDRKNPLVQPAITPRFALSVDMPLMNKLGVLAEHYDLVIQTHISENLDEIQMVKQLYDGDSYAEVYDKAKLLTPKTVLAHGVHLAEDERALIAERGASISHCPNSNTRLKSGMCDVRSLQKSGVNVALGTDVSGGAAVSVIDAMRGAIDTSTHVSYQNADYVPITCYEAFYMATMGGAKALGIDGKVGSLEEGKEFDALIIDMDVPDSSADLFGEYSAEELFQKFVFLGDDRNVRQVYVAGKRVK